MTNPVGLDIAHPRLNWKIESPLHGVLQTAYQLVIFDAEGSVEKRVYDSGKVPSSQSVGVELHNMDFASRKRYYWQIKVWDNKGNVSDWSERAFFEFAFLTQDCWSAKWIEPVQRPSQPDLIGSIEEMFESVHENDTKDYSSLNPCLFIRKEFLVGNAIARARLYATAHGIYDVEINGGKIGHSQFSPGVTAYDDYLEYQTYDITDCLSQGGNNAIGIILADGWYAGRIGGPGTNMNYGDKLGLLMQLEIEYQDGTRQVIYSDESFKGTTGPFIYADIFIGEMYDARREINGWSQTGYDDKDWRPVIINNRYGYDNLVAEYGEPVRPIKEIKAQNIIISPRGERIIDFGQIIAGRVRIRLSGNKGDRVVIEHSEILDEQGNFLNNIMGRNKQQKDIYILKGTESEIYQPRFTFHGFRYAKISDYPAELQPDDISAIVLASDLKISGHFECSDKDINQLQHNILWSQIGNMFSIPMDCPQRERAGWSGDVWVYAATAAFNMDMNPFFTRWLRNVQIEQRPDGQVPMLVPYWKGYQTMGKILFEGSHTSAGWGDVCTILPWTLYSIYGDKRVLEENYPMMLKWLRYIEAEAANNIPENLAANLSEEEKERQKYLWNTGFHFGDWLIPSFLSKENQQEGMIDCASSTKEITASCFFAYSSDIVAKVANVLGDSNTENKYLALSEKIRTSFAATYLDNEAHIAANYQGIHVLALKLNMIPQHLKAAFFENLVKLIAENGYRLDTGFVSVPFLMDVLCENGRSDIAVRLLYQRECPSWLYQIDNGATTLWESWSAIKPSGERTNVSYNHCAFGCVGDWLYRYIAGIHLAHPGYKEIVIHPHPDSKLEYAKASYDSVYGAIESAWRITAGKLVINIKIPANATAKIILPAAMSTDVHCNGGNLQQASGIADIQQNAEGVILAAGSGKYQFSYPYTSRI
ncbi:alpha-L-rhamnosidase [Brenneria tiliae]|uniref:alpha-L-rhamnosidase n=1 Tax=Brenneria tiliae TaxID=2914984 RepID=A0ABT0MWQ1_9GAMM|nr:alpha-L-rhamnosidase [Brenneria tiliae]MCL2894270.1 glycoside hydrolase family 78 protein [Brenneria tiliae]